MSDVSHAKAVLPAPGILPAPGTVNLIALAVIDVRPQVRKHFDARSLTELAESVRANGMLAPVLLRPGKNGRFELIAGERRVRAAKAAGFTHVPAISGAADDRAKLRMQLAENLDREDLDEREVCAAVKALFDQERDIGKVAAIVKRSKAWVSKRLAAATSYGWETRRLLESGATEDMEILGAFNQLEKLTEWRPEGAPVSRQDLEAVGKQIRAGKIGRDELREKVAVAKAKGAEAATKAKKKEKSRAERAAKPRKLKPEELAAQLVSGAEDYHCTDELLKQAFAEHEPAALAAAEATLRASYDRGVAARQGAKDPRAEYAALRTGLSTWRPGKSEEAWLAGWCGIPFSLEAICNAQRAAGKLQDEQDREDGRA